MKHRHRIESAVVHGENTTQNINTEPANPGLGQRSMCTDPDTEAADPDFATAVERTEDQLAEVSESLCKAFEEVGISRSAFEATLPEARRRVFARRYPQLAYDLAHDMEATK